jgi:DNA-binding transcriptional MerR regulator
MGGNRKTFRIGEVAQQAGVSVPAVRYYERLGLLMKAARTESGVRRYPADAIERIRFVKQAQGSGLALGEIRDLIALKNQGTRRCRQVQKLLRTKIANLDAQRAELDEFRRVLQALADQCEESLAAAPDPDCPVLAKL